MFDDILPQYYAALHMHSFAPVGSQVRQMPEPGRNIESLVAVLRIESIALLSLNPQTRRCFSVLG